MRGVFLCIKKGQHRWPDGYSDILKLNSELERNVPSREWQ